MATQNLSSINDISTLSKILPGITKSDLSNIEDSAKINSIVNLVNASNLNAISMTSIQVNESNHICLANILILISELIAYQYAFIFSRRAEENNCRK